MSAILIGVIVVPVVALAALIVRRRTEGGPPAKLVSEPGARRTLFPFVSSALSRRALDAALRLARAESATLVPVFLARVPLHLPLDAQLPRQAAIAIPLQEAIEQRAGAYGVPVDCRLERGRTYRHALRQTISDERFDRIVIAAAVDGAHGFLPDDVAWLLAHAPGEILVVRPGAEDQLVPIAPRPPRRTMVNGRRASRNRRDVLRSS
ncbi:MAG TPA: universal stress protein [Solirubrobacteraceae bacterium]|jgi:nucleotide-binding universal stress UspA family protein|nr:universal stress protein [Solirubrobacteraceae bacterium]